MTRLAILALTLAATPAPAADQRYAALGTEPFWSLTVEGRVLRLDEAGRGVTRAGGARVRPSVAGRRITARAMTVDIVRTRCSDGMSDRVYPDTVSVTLGRRTLSGCGGLFAAGR